MTRRSNSICEMHRSSKAPKVSNIAANEMQNQERFRLVVWFRVLLNSLFYFGNKVLFTKCRLFAQSSSNVSNFFNSLRLSTNLLGVIIAVDPAINSVRCKQSEQKLYQRVFH